MSLEYMAYQKFGVSVLRDRPLSFIAGITDSSTTREQAVRALNKLREDYPDLLLAAIQKLKYTEGYDPVMIDDLFGDLRNVKISWDSVIQLYGLFRKWFVEIQSNEKG